MKQLEKAPASSGEEAGGARGSINPQRRIASKTVQTEEQNGSFSADDTNRPRWDSTTVLEAEYDYHRQDGSHSHTVLKGRRADGRKAFLKGRRFDGSYSDLDIARREPGRKFYTFPGLRFFEKGADE